MKSVLLAHDFRASGKSASLRFCEACAQSNPLSKTIELLESLQAKVVKDGENSQKVYEEFKESAAGAAHGPLPCSALAVVSALSGEGQAGFWR